MFRSRCRDDSAELVGIAMRTRSTRTTNWSRNRSAILDAGNSTNIVYMTRLMDNHGKADSKTRSETAESHQIKERCIRTANISRRAPTSSDHSPANLSHQSRRHLFYRLSFAIHSIILHFSVFPARPTSFVH